MPRASKLLPSLGHAASGAGGTVVSTLVIYPLDLVNTRLKVQRQLRADGTIRECDAYGGILDAFRAIYSKEGGISAFFVGLGPDVAKSAADSFLFFLFYTWFRARRLRTSDARYLRVWEELAVGAAAGACSKAFTTPVSNVVTRQQTASLLGNGSSEKATFGETVAEIRSEKGLLGLWAGYSASLVLTLNPSMTFFLQQMLKRMLVPRESWDEPGGLVTFLLAALSKVSATSITYPFQIAKARVQVSAKPGEKGGSGKQNGRPKSPVNRASRETIFGTVSRIARTEGVKALYDGIGGELLKGFFSHGTTMVAKDFIHALLVRFYLALLIFLQRYPRVRARVLEKMRKTQGDLMRWYQMAKLISILGRQRGAQAIKRALGSGEKAMKDLLWASGSSN
ncbi:mitochondrial carrier domain-containing protein [Cercophora newfieldiana]|uniref:Mitochondrial carrier domain-containing protein n=1 Tax=Cercophora newfieldiana TaxID=92897 RepID=A0AA39Y5U7_9PEZI|nr:mitochondrial carrier domain-containing protein [Cercophora newfieldiana]